MIINWEKARNITGDDPELYKDLWMMILESLDEKMQSIHTSLASGDWKESEFSVHKLKGALRNVAAEDACALLQQMEDAARSGDMGKTNSYLPKVIEMVNDVVSFFETANIKKEFSSN